MHKLIKGIGKARPELGSDSGIGGGAEVSKRPAASTKEQVISKSPMRVRGLVTGIVDQLRVWNREVDQWGKSDATNSYASREE